MSGIKKNIQTLKDFAITEEIINYAASESMMTFRDGAKYFLKSMYDKKIPIIIISAGVGNIIEQFLIRNNCYYSNILIYIHIFISLFQGLTSDSYLSGIYRALPYDKKYLLLI